MRIKFASQKGATMVEFALILIPLLIITFGIIEFGMYIYNKQIITNASREGARAGIVASLPRLSDAEIDSVVKNYCLNNLVTFGAQNIPPTTTATHPAQEFGDPLTVQVNYTYSFFVIPNIIPGIKTLLTQISSMHATTVMKYE
jgi:Flp pilus assembly protein TadG